jgi:hypothetical protein
MRAWTIVVFILAIHAVLAMVNVAHITDIGLNISLDTSGGGVLVTPGMVNMTTPSSTYFNESYNKNGTGSDIKNTSGIITGTSGGFVGKMIELIIGAADTFIKLMTTFSSVIFTIYYVGAPYIGTFNAMVLEGMVDIIFGVALFQMVTGRSFKTME